MALTEQTKDVQLEIYVNPETGSFTSAVATRRVEIVKDGVPYGSWDKQVSLTLSQVKSKVAALTNGG